MRRRLSHLLLTGHRLSPLALSTECLICGILLARGVSNHSSRLFWALQRLPWMPRLRKKRLLELRLLRLRLLLLLHWRRLCAERTTGLLRCLLHHGSAQMLGLRLWLQLRMLRRHKLLLRVPLRLLQLCLH